MAGAQVISVSRRQLGQAALCSSKRAWPCAGVGAFRGAGRPAAICAAKGGVAEGPVTIINPSKSASSSKQRPPNYKVMLHNDNYNRREYVVQTLLKVVDVLTLDEAVNTMNEAHASGVALITMCAQHDAERYTEGLRTNGLTSSMEPSK